MIAARTESATLLNSLILLTVLSQERVGYISTGTLTQQLALLHSQLILLPQLQIQYLAYSSYSTSRLYT